MAIDMGTESMTLLATERTWRVQTLAAAVHKAVS